MSAPILHLIKFICMEQCLNYHLYYLRSKLSNVSGPSPFNALCNDTRILFCRKKKKYTQITPLPSYDFTFQYCLMVYVVKKVRLYFMNDNLRGNLTGNTSVTNYFVNLKNRPR